MLAEIRYWDEGVVLELHGRLDNAAQEELERAVMSVMAQYRGPILVDMTDVDFICSAAIRLLALCVMLRRQQQREFGLINLPPDVERVIEVVRMRDYFSPSPGAALPVF